MGIDFSKFDKAVDTRALAEEVKKAPKQEYDDVPDGEYITKIEKMEIKPTKNGDKLMFAVQMRITNDKENGKQHNRLLFMNRVIYGNRQSEQWNDGRAIKSVQTWLDKLDLGIDTDFTTYEAFADTVLDIFQECDSIELLVKYQADTFNSITIKEVYDA